MNQTINIWYNGNGEPCDISKIPINTIFVIPKCKANYFFVKNNKNIEYCGGESGNITLIRKGLTSGR